MTKMKSIGALALGLALVAAACGDDGGDRPEVAWADEICGAALEWQESVTAVFDELGLDDVAAVVTGGVDEVAQRLEPVADATEKLADALSEVGLPESEQAEAAQDEIDDIVAEVETLGDLVTDDVSELESSDDLIGEVTTLVGDAAASVDSLISSLQSLDELDVLGELQSGVEDSQACQELRGDS